MLDTRHAVLGRRLVDHLLEVESELRSAGRVASDLDHSDPRAYVIQRLLERLLDDSHYARSLVTEHLEALRRQDGEVRELQSRTRPVGAPRP